MAWAGGAAGPLPGGLTGIWELWEKGQEGLPARCPQQSRPQGPSVAAGTGAAKGKAGLERARASRGSGVCASPLPPPIHVPGGVLALAKGSPTPSSVQNWVGRAAGAGTNAVISPFIYQNSSHLETHSPGRHHRGREPPPILVYTPGSAQGEGSMVARQAILGGGTWLGQARSLSPRRALPGAWLLTKTPAHLELLPSGAWEREPAGFSSSSRHG